MTALAEVVSDHGVLAVHQAAALLDTTPATVLEMVAGDTSLRIDGEGFIRSQPHPTDKDMFMNALGALLASTMRSDLDDDYCETDR